MKFVEIYKVNNGGSQNVLAVCTLTADGVKIDGDIEFISNLNSGIDNYSSEIPKKLYPKDGILFLEQLKFNFKSGYLNASEVKEA